MKKISFITLIMLLLTSHAQAGQTHLLHGLFCNTEAQAKEVLARLGKNQSLRAAVAVTNMTNVTCVVADKIQYMVVQPVIIGTVRQNGLTLTLYEASLIGVLVGDNPRPVVPPVRSFFVLNELLAGVTIQGGA